MSFNSEALSKEEREAMDFEDLWDEIESERQEKAKNAKATLLGMGARLPGVVTIRIEYNGSGDSGEIDSVIFLSAEGKAVKIGDNDLIDAISEDARDLLPIGWEIDEGSFGELTIDLVKGTVHRIHNERFESVKTTEDDL
jgi:hypothetical protein